MNVKIERRVLNGIVLLDKPIGISSNRALQQVKRLFRAKKAGHTGTLDPLATGMLPICFGTATRVSAFLLESHKSYEFRCRLGVVTDSGDSEGEVIERVSVPVLDEALIESVLQKYRGDIQQVPPMYSALKHKGERLYKLARKGETVERLARPVRIFELQLLAFNADTLSLTVRCSKGTYVRSLAEDIGRDLGCGAHVDVLRRTGVEPFQRESMLALEQLEALAKQSVQNMDAVLLAPDAGLIHLPEYHLDEAGSESFIHGRKVPTKAALPTGMFRIYADSGLFLGLGETGPDGNLIPKRVFV